MNKTPKGKNITVKEDTVLKSDSVLFVHLREHSRAYHIKPRRPHVVSFIVATSNPIPAPNCVMDSPVIVPSSFDARGVVRRIR